MVSYVLVPINAVLMLVVTIGFVARSTDYITGGGALTKAGHYFIALGFADAAIFVVLFALTMTHRREPAIHARYMMCTPLPVIAAATDRIV
jgi:hypothetical protein